jgi:multiple sugar transport system substrate-binding protein
MKKMMLTLMCATLALSGAACSKEESGPGTSLDPSQSPSQSIGQTQTQKPDNTLKPVKTKDGKTLVTLALIASESYMTEAEQKFEAVHPDIDIQIKPLVESESISNTEVEKYNNQMRTELLSGKGADLYQTDGDQIVRYANKKLLANLSERLSADSSFDKSQFFDNILGGSKINGNLFGIPLSFAFYNILLGDEGAIQAAGLAIDDKTWTWAQFSEFAGKLLKTNKGSSRYALNSSPPEHMLMLNVHESYSILVDESSHKANFQSDVFKSMMEQVKNMYANKILSSEKTKYGDSFFVPTTVARPKDYFYEMSRYQKGKIYLKPHTSGSKEVIPFNASTMMVINEKSAVKGEAWEFIKFLMSEEMQSSPNLYGFPINKAAYGKLVDELRKSVKNGTLPVQQDNIIVIDGKEITMPSSVKVTDQDFDNLAKLVSGANYLSTSDTKVEEIVSEEAKAYFSGQKSADEVAKLIQNRVTTYLNE